MDREELIKEHNAKGDEQPGDEQEPEYSEDTLNYQVRTKGMKYFIALFLVGIFNNNGFVLVQAGANSLSKEFGESDFMGVFQFTMTVLSICTRFTYGLALVNVAPMTKIRVVSAFAVLAFLLLALASWQHEHKAFFAVAVAATVFVGISCGLGEATFLGFLKGFPGHLVGFVSSGTGFAGLSGTGMLLLLQGPAQLSNQAIFLIATPTIIVYYAAFAWLNQQKNMYVFISEKAPPTSKVTESSDSQNQPINPSAVNTTENSRLTGMDPTQEEKNTPITLQSLREIWPKAFPLIINLFSVYIFEYSIITCFADRMALKVQAKYPQRAGEFSIDQYFVILNMSYQIGVFMSRSSLQVIKIQKVWILSALQGINFVLFFLNTQFLVVENVWILAPACIWVGLMGGASYVNVMHSILEHKTLLKQEKESALALSLVFNDTGILLASIFTLVMDNTLFKMADK